MKLKAILSFCAILCASALFADNWTYFYSEEDSTYKVTDNVWTFKASVSDELLTVSEVLDYPEEISMLDFSKPVTDADGNSYTIRTLSPQFAKNKNSWKEFEAKDAAMASKPEFDEIAFTSARMNERIQMLSDYLPDFLVENHNIYSILSKGVHELSEEDCKEYFTVLKESIEIILDEKLEADRKAKHKKTIGNAIAEITGTIK
jgi:hypothetical protein